MVNVQYGVHKRLKLVNVLSQMNQISTAASRFSVSTKYFKDDQTEEYEVAGQVDAWERRYADRVLVGNLKERDHL
jgi:muramidase (phage lysozyme)